LQTQSQFSSGGWEAVAVDPQSVYRTGKKASIASSPVNIMSLFIFRISLSFQNQDNNSTGKEGVKNRIPEKWSQTPGSFQSLRQQNMFSKR
jgi:hypothetical protein